MIVVVDSGVWISALQFGGLPPTVVERIGAEHTFAICEAMVNEVRIALKRKSGWSEAELEEAFAFYCSPAAHVHISGHLRGVCRAPKDDMVIECAVTAAADFVVSGDKDLLTVRNYRGIRILTPRESLGEFSPKG
ncbi:MAG: putative toxin-antitoxin system toxin component, PIN family [Acidobacteriota bacterium]